MNEQAMMIGAIKPDQILQLKQEIITHWDRLPPEHQASMLLVLLDNSAWAGWSVRVWLSMNPHAGGGS